MLRKVFLSSVLSIVLLSTNAFAEFLELDLVTEGDGLVVLDTRTNMEWLDFSSGMSTINRPLADINPNSFEGLNGFRLATEDEVLELMNSTFTTLFNTTVYDQKVATGSLTSAVNHTIVEGNAEDTKANYDSLLFLIEKLGVTNSYYYSWTNGSVTSFKEITAVAAGYGGDASINSRITLKANFSRNGDTRVNSHQGMYSTVSSPLVTGISVNRFMVREAAVSDVSAPAIAGAGMLTLFLVSSLVRKRSA